MHLRFALTAILISMLLTTWAKAQSTPHADTTSINKPIRQAGADIIEYQTPPGTTVQVYNRETNNNAHYTDSTARVEIESLYRMIKNGYNFYDLAVNYSQDPGSYRLGGQLKPTTMAEYVPEFRMTILSLSVGEISRPFKTDFGYHIAQLISVHDTIYVTRHILLRVD